MLKLFRRFAFIILTAVVPILAMGQGNYSFFYFESDLTTPVYVKVEGQMQPRMGQNYALIPNLAAGYTQFEILFQQNKYPAQKFWLQVPEDSYRGFAVKVLDGKDIALYDLQQKKLIFPDNIKGDDVAGNFKINKFEATEEKLPDLIRNEKPIGPSALPLLTDSIIILPENNPKSTKETYQKTTESTKDNSFSEPDFIGGIVFNSDGNEGSTSSATTSVSAACPNVMSNMQFETFASALMNIKDDQLKLKKVQAAIKNTCFTTEQVRIMGNDLSGQAARLDLTKMLYPRTSDKENYSRLEALFHTPFLKEQFQKILQ